MRKSSGYTLIEVVIVTLIIGIFLSGVYIIFDQGIKMYAKDETQVANQGSIRTLLTSIEKKIRAADSAVPVWTTNDNQCLYISNSKTTPDYYCKVDNTITHNDIVIIDRISVFLPSVPTPISVDADNDVKLFSVNISITSIPDSMGQSNSASATFNVRLKGK